MQKSKPGEYAEFYGTEGSGKYARADFEGLLALYEQWRALPARENGEKIGWGLVEEGDARGYLEEVMFARRDHLRDRDLRLQFAYEDSPLELAANHVGNTAESIARQLIPAAA